MSGQEVVQVVHPTAPPVFDVGRLQPADVEAHVEGCDELLPGERLLGGGHDAWFQWLSLTHEIERNPADAAGVAGWTVAPDRSG
jgi:hypothetical protein